MHPIAKIRFALVAVVTLFVLPLPAHADRVLNVPLAEQQHNEWCWAGSSDAVLRYYATQVNQCDMADFAWSREDCCGNEEFAWDHPCNEPNYMYGQPGSIQDILDKWGRTSDPQGSHLAKAVIAVEVNAGRPFILRYGWKPEGGHFIVGRGLVDDLVYLMDPWPGNGYSITDYDAVVSSDTHDWTHTLKMKEDARALVLAHSGVSACFSADATMACPEPGEEFHGQDGNHVATSAPLLFYDQADGTVLDQNTGLIWQQADDGTGRTWDQATTHCADLELGGRTDWRLPTRFELLGIVDHGGAENGLRPVFQGRPQKYWTATQSVYEAPDYAWFVDHETVGISNFGQKQNTYLARCVSGDPVAAGEYTRQGDVVIDAATGLTWQQGYQVDVTWQQALRYCDVLELGGHDDWRMPSIREMQSIVDDTRSAPALDPVFDSGRTATGFYWTGTTASWLASGAWVVGPYYGATPSANAKSMQINYIVRCVRGFGDMEDRHNLQMQVNGPGRISNNQQDAACGNTCTLPLLPTGTQVKLTAQANEGAVFVNWTEGGAEVSDNASLTVDMTDDRTLVANFQASDPQAIPTLSEWGMIALALLFMAAFSRVRGHRGW